MLNADKLSDKFCVLIDLYDSKTKPLISIYRGDSNSEAVRKL